MKDLRDVSFIVGINIIRDCSQFVIVLSQKSYINEDLSRFDME